MRGGGAGTVEELRALAIRLVVHAQSRPPLELARLAPSSAGRRPRAIRPP